MTKLAFFLLLTFCVNAFAAGPSAPPNWFQKSVAANVSMGASINSSTADLKYVRNASMQFVWSAGTSPVGELKMQGSNDDVSSSASVTNWIDLSTSVYNGSVAVSGNTGSYLYNLTNLGFRWLRGVYTRTSGTATMNAVFVGKGS